MALFKAKRNRLLRLTTKTMLPSRTEGKPSWIILAMQKTSYLKLSTSVSVVSFVAMATLSDKTVCLDDSVASELAFSVHLLCSSFFMFEAVLGVGVCDQVCIKRLNKKRPVKEKIDSRVPFSYFEAVLLAFNVAYAVVYPVFCNKNAAVQSILAVNLLTVCRVIRRVSTFRSGLMTAVRGSYYTLKISAVILAVIVVATIIGTSVFNDSIFKCSLDSFSEPISESVVSGDPPRSAWPTTARLYHTT